MATHRINLRGPWDYQFLGNQSGTEAMPREWRLLFGDRAGTATFRRKFHRPTNLDPHEQVLIVFTEVGGSGRVWINDQPVGDFTAHGELVEFEITKLLKPFNELSVEIAFDPGVDEQQQGGLFGVTALEIRSE